jgi:hypothetical protein
MTTKVIRPRIFYPGRNLPTRARILQFPITLTCHCEARSAVAIPSCGLGIASPIAGLAMTNGAAPCGASQFMRYAQYML